MTITAATIIDDLEADANRTLGKIARRLLAEAANDADAAIVALEARLATDQALRQLLADRAIRALIRARVETAIANERAAVVAERARRGPRRDDGPERVAALANAVRGFMDFPLRGGRVLAEATRAEVLDQARSYALAGASMSHNARWLRAIAERLPDDGARVREALTEAEVAALRATTATTEPEVRDDA
jgi:hypothetical protein